MKTTCANVMQMTSEQVLDIAVLAGKILLCSGAETYRVEDTITRMCAVRGMNSVTVFCTPSVIIVSDEFANGCTLMYRATRRGTDLGLISEINNLSFNWYQWPYSYESTMRLLKEKLERPTRPPWLVALASGVGAAAFAVMLGGNTYDFCAALAAGFMAMLVLRKLAVFRPSSFWETTLAGIILSLVAVAAVQINHECNLENVIVGAIMPFLPGVALTNGLRDYMAGDLMSGNASVSEAVLLVGGLAVGMAAILSVWYM